MDVRELGERPALLPLYVRAALPRRTAGDAVPQVALRLPQVRPDVEHVAAYARVCGFSLAADLPLTYPHLLGFPLQMAVMADPGFPFPATGMVHVRNRVEQRRPVPVARPLDVVVRAAGPHLHPRGRAVDLLTEVSADGEVVWTSTSTYLRRSPRPTGDAFRTPQAAPRGAESVTSREREGEGEEQERTTAVWRLPADLGRRYAAVSGDRNPIHLHPLAARAFGFSRTIAHGMWTAAAAAAHLQGRLPDAVGYDVTFAAPVLLPSTVELASRVEDGTAAVLLRSRSGRVHLRGTLAPLAR